MAHGAWRAWRMARMAQGAWYMAHDGALRRMTVAHA